MFEDGLIFPALALALAGWLVPRLLSRVWPEGVKPLFALAFVSTLILIALSAAFIIGLYVWGGVPLGQVFSLGVAAVAVHFGRLALISALFWGPMLILSVAGLPRHWTRERW